MANFASDNTAPVHPKVMAALMAVNDGNVPAYGNDPITQGLQARFAETFRAPDVTVFPVFNGSACNGLALACMIRPYESILAHQQSHINNDECGLPEFFTGGKIIGFEGDHAKIKADDLEQTIINALGHAPHTSRPRVISVTQSTELGTTYKLDELKALSALARKYDMYLHMDGARIANAAASLGCHPSEIVAGVDILSFGGTKNGAMLAEAAVIFNSGLAEHFAYVHKRSGQLPSKARYVSAQLQALLDNDLWLELGAHANRQAVALRDGLLAIDGVRLLHPVEANELFVIMPKSLTDRLYAKGHRFYNWPNEALDAYRLVTSFATTDADVQGFLRDCG